MKRIESIELLGSTYKIKWVDRITEEKEKEKEKEEEKETSWLFGRTTPSLRTIEIATLNEKDEPMIEEQIATTFWHEVSHAIIVEGCYSSYNKDEPFIEWVGKNLKFLIENNKL